MDLIYFEYFHKAAELQHITRAAQALNITQPTLSTAIRKLEAELGMRLFEPDGRNIRLTQAGQALQKHTGRILREVQAAYDELNNMRELNNNRITIICPSQIFNMEAMQEIHRRNPSITINRRDRFALQTRADLAAGTIDLFISTPPYQSGGYKCEHLAPDPMMVLCSIEHPLSALPEIDISRLFSESFIVYPPSELRDLIEMQCRDAGFVPHAACEIANVRDMLPLIAYHQMVALAPAGACQECGATPGIAVKRLVGITRRTDMGISYPGDRPLKTASRIVRDVFIDLYRKDPERLLRKLPLSNDP